MLLLPCAPERLGAVADRHHYGNSVSDTFALPLKSELNCNILTSMENRLYLDNCCFNRPYDDQSILKNYLEAEAKVYIQKEILNKKYELAWSYMMDYEVSFNPFTDRKIQIMKWKNLAIADIDESGEV